MTEEPVTDFKPKSLDDVLKTDAPEPEKTPEPAPEVKPEETPLEKVEPDKAEGEASKGEAEPEKEDATADQPTDAPPASDQKDDQPTVPLKALQDERRKRQGLEGRMAELERQQAQKARPDPYEDPDGAAAFDRDQAQANAFAMRCEMSQEMMRELHGDYDEVESAFMEEAGSNPALAAQLARHPFPAKFAYTEGKRLQQLQAMGDDPVAYIERVKAEAAKAGAAAALEAIQKQQADAQKASVPESLAEAPSASRAEVKQWAGPKPLSEILK